MSLLLRQARPGVLQGCRRSGCSRHEIGLAPRGGGERAQPRARPRPRPVDGSTGHRPSPRSASRRAGGRVRPGADGVLVRAARLAGERSDRGARARRRLFYVLVYTRWLKRSTPQNIVIGGAAGAVPPLVGWAAATGNLRLPALFLFLIVFFWTPPHFWALALLIKRDYAAARVPMLPVVRGDDETAQADRAVLARARRGDGGCRSPGGTLGARLPGRRAVLGAIFLRLAHGGCGARPPPPAPARSSTTRSSTSRCCSWRWRSTRCSMAEHGPEFERRNTRIGLADVRALRGAGRARVRGRLHLPRDLLPPEGIFLARPEQPAEGIPPRSRTCSTPRGGHDLRLPVRRARPARDWPRRCGGWRRPATRTSARPTCTSSRSARPPRTEHFGTVRNPRDGRVAGGSSGGSRRRWRPGSSTRRSAPTPAARSGSRRRAAASSDSSRPGASCRPKTSSRSRRATTTRVRWPATSRAASRCCRRWRPGSSRPS